MIGITESKTSERNMKEHGITREDLFESTIQHIGDVKRALNFLMKKIYDRADRHDLSKLREIDDFYACYDPEKREFKQDAPWFESHYEQERHHLGQFKPVTVNLIDVIEQICDIVMAGKARTGQFIFDRDRGMLSAELLQEAYLNTVRLLADNVEVVGDGTYEDSDDNFRL